MEQKQKTEAELELMRTSAELDIARAELELAVEASKHAVASSRRGQWMGYTVFMFILSIALVAVLGGQALAGILLATAGLSTVLLALYGVGRINKSRNNSIANQRDRTLEEPDAAE
jgi:hypothetical protein